MEGNPRNPANTPLVEYLPPPYRNSNQIEPDSSSVAVSFDRETDRLRRASLGLSIAAICLGVWPLAIPAIILTMVAWSSGPASPRSKSMFITAIVLAVLAILTAIITIIIAIPLVYVQNEVSQGKKSEMIVPVVITIPAVAYMESGSFLGDNTSQKLEPDKGADVMKRKKVVEMIKHAWDGYVKYAWGANEVRPISKSASSSSIFGWAQMGVTIIDSLDTLYIVGLTEEYEKAKEWVENEFKFEAQYDVSVFEVNIRLVGGLLSAYALTHEDVFLKHAVNVATKLLPAFNTRTGIPNSAVNLVTNTSLTWGWTPGSCSVLSEFGALSMEFLYLSKLTGDNTYREKIEKMMAQLNAEDGLYYNYVDPDKGVFCSKVATIGACGDSFYEYLFKTWQLTGHYESKMKTAYDSAMEAIFKRLYQTSAKGHHYFAELQSGSLRYRMEHLGCFIGGLLGLSAKDSPDEKRYMTIAEAIGETCHQSYNMTQTGLGPESFSFAVTEGAITVEDRAYLLRPEVVETYFYMWRLTHDQKWRNYGWEAVEAIEKHCRAEGGYSGLKDVDALPPGQDDIQQSFFLAETLKYLYLLFSPDDVIPLNKFVFNTEGHPLPIF